MTRPFRLSSCVGLAALAAGAASCSGTQSALDPAGPAASAIARLWWLFFSVLATVYVLVVAAAIFGVFRRRDADPAPDGADLHGETDRSDVSERKMIGVIAGCVGITVLVLIGFLFASVGTGRALAGLESRDDFIEIQVTGHQWWWEITYKHAEPAKQVTSANEIHLPLNQRVLIRTASTDVIHSLWIPNLHGKRDLVPGLSSELWLQADKPGVYRAQCAEFCGIQHAKMAMLVVVEPMAAFNDWLDRQRQPATSPATPAQQRGQDVFLTGPCALCHRIGGTPAGSRVGPDLTHFGSRATIAAGSAPNNPGYLAAWLADPQHLKPGARMPATALDSEDIQAVVAYLQSLK